MSKNLSLSTEQQEWIDNVDALLSYEYNLSWPTLRRLVEEKSHDPEIKHFVWKSYQGFLEKLHDGTTGRGKDVLYWRDLALITRKIRQDISGGSSSNETLKTRLLPNTRAIQKRVCYGYFKNQDTMIPRYFESAYKVDLPNIDFIPFEDWNDGLEAFKSKKVHVALRDFATTVAYNTELPSKSPLLFYPFFSFNGYCIFIKKHAIRAFCKSIGSSKSSFRSLSLDERAAFLEQQHYLVEQRTDFEWILDRFCIENGCTDLAKVKALTTYRNTRSGKIEFNDNKIYTIYSTNPAHMIGLLRSNQYELAPPIKVHNNFNGLIFTEEYARNNQDIIALLIKRWFETIEMFTSELSTLRLPAPSRPESYRPTYTVTSLVADLGGEIEETLTPENLPQLYEYYNKFYQTPQSAFDEFYPTLLTDTEVLDRYIDIASIQLNRPIDDRNKVVEMIKMIKTTTDNL
jgi:hypothetical protein